MIYITGDTHRDFQRIEEFCRSRKTTYDDIMIILGDACINFFGGRYDEEIKSYLLRIPITFFCVHGNHEQRPEKIPGYQEVNWHGGRVYRELCYPNILFAKDGEIFDFDGKKAVVLGGAYNIDKEFRLQNGLPWFADEQPSEAIKKHAEETLSAAGWKVDFVFSHTVPHRCIPKEVLRNGVDQRTVDKTTELWLDSIEERLEYTRWYCGHFHLDAEVEKVTFLFERVERL